MIVGKAFLNSPPGKQSSEGQQVLSCFLAKKHARYLQRRGSRPLGLNTSLEDNGEPLPQSSAEDLLSRSTSTVHEKELSISLKQERSTFRLCLASLKHQQQNGRVGVHSQTSHACSGASGKNGSRLKRNSSQSGLIGLGSEELAEQVVSRAKGRLKHRRNSNSSIKKRSGVERLEVAQEVYKPLSKLYQSRSSRAPNATSSRQGLVRSSTPISGKTSSSATPLSQSPLKRESSKASLNRSLERAEAFSRSGVPKCAAKRVVYFSERQSVMCKDTGVPGVPPTTPSTATALIEDVKYVPSMSDIKSQRDLKNQLQAISLAKQEAAEREQQVQAEREKKQKQDEKTKLKMQQRAEIYALNKVMAEFERQKFEAFKSGKV